MKFANLLTLTDGSQFLALYLYDDDEDNHNVEYHTEFDGGMIKLTLTYNDEETALKVVSNATVKTAEAFKKDINEKYGI